jgi:hypothetical protein
MLLTIQVMKEPKHFYRRWKNNYLCVYKLNSWI